MAQGEQAAVDVSPRSDPPRTPSQFTPYLNSLPPGRPLRAELLTLYARQRRGVTRANMIEYKYVGAEPVRPEDKALAEGLAALHLETKRLGLALRTIAKFCDSLSEKLSSSNDISTDTVSSDVDSALTGGMDATIMPYTGTQKATFTSDLVKGLETEILHTQEYVKNWSPGDD